MRSMTDASIPRAVRCTTAVALAALIVLAVAACGSAKASSPTIVSSTGASSTGVVSTGASRSGASGAVQKEFEAYRACLQEHGVDNGGGSGGRGDRASGAGGDGAAQSACAALRPAPGTGANGGFGASGASGAGAPQFSAYLSCLSDNGVAAATTAGRRALSAIDRSTPAFAAANAKCKVLLPDGVDPFAGGGARGGPPGVAPTTTAAN